MSQMIDGARDEFDALDPLESDRSANVGDSRSRRGRRAVIVDESYGDEAFSGVEPEFNASDDMFFEEEEEERRERPRRGYEAPAKNKPLAIQSERPAKEPRNRGGAVWGWAILAALIWVGAVLGFSAGLLRLPAQSAGQIVAAAMSLDPRLQLIILAATVAPLGLIVQTAISAKRSQRLAAETRRLNRLIADMGATPGRAGAQSGNLREEAEEATRAFSALEAGFEAAEERMQLARSRFETERATLSKMVEDLDGDVARMTRALTSLTGAASDATRAHAVEFADMVASAMATHGGLPVAPARASNLTGDSPRERVQRMAEATGQSIGGDDDFERSTYSDQSFAGDDYAAPDYAARDSSRDVGDDLGQPLGGDAATQEISALQRRLRGGLDEVDSGVDDDAALEDEPYSDDALDPDYGDDAFGQTETDEPGYEETAPATEGGLDWAKLVRAANFPDSEDDRETLDALYAVLTDREAAALLQSAEDALSSLADFGLFMEDMQPRHAPVELWRAFVVDDARGEDVMDLGGVRDPHAIEDVAAALHDKPEFEETAKRFLERYESVLARLFHEAPTPRMAVELADTRSGRAYMLIGRAFGRFG